MPIPKRGFVLGEIFRAKLSEFHLFKFKRILFSSGSELDTKENFASKEKYRLVEIRLKEDINLTWTL